MVLGPHPPPNIGTKQSATHLCISVTLGSDPGLVRVGEQCVFLWNASTGATQKLLETSGAGNIVTSLAWGDDPTCNTLAGQNTFLCLKRVV